MTMKYIYLNPTLYTYIQWRVNIAGKVPNTVGLAPMWQQSGTLLFCSCHGIAGFLVDELQI